MESELRYTSDIAFTPSVKAIQTRKGSRGAYANMEQGSGWKTEITEDLKAFIEAQISVFLAALHPAPRWSAGLHEGSGWEYHRLR
jgi:hypothetical protein